jgi:hypothetical protein
MKPLKPILYLVFVMSAFLCLFGCTKTQHYMPQLNNNPHPVLDSINHVYGFEQISLDAKKTSGSGGNHDELVMECINGKNIPQTNDDKKALAKQIARQFRLMLVNPNEFDMYTVLFDVRTVNGAETNNTYTGYQLKVSEL